MNATDYKNFHRFKTIFDSLSVLIRENKTLLQSVNLWQNLKTLNNPKVFWAKPE